MYFHSCISLDRDNCSLNLTYFFFSIDIIFWPFQKGKSYCLGHFCFLFIFVLQVSCLLVEDVTRNLNILEPSTMKRFSMDLVLQRHVKLFLMSCCSLIFVIAYQLCFCYRSNNYGLCNLGSQYFRMVLTKANLKDKLGG